MANQPEQAATRASSDAFRPLFRVDPGSNPGRAFAENAMRVRQMSLAAFRAVLASRARNWSPLWQDAIRSIEGYGVVILGLSAILVIWAGTLLHISGERQQVEKAAVQTGSNLALAFEEQIIRSMSAVFPASAW